MNTVDYDGTEAIGSYSQSLYGRERSYEVGVSLEVSGLQFQSRLVLNVALISAVDGEYQGQGPLEIIS
jgi:hypothetical protein